MRKKRKLRYTARKKGNLPKRIMSRVGSGFRARCLTMATGSRRKNRFVSAGQDVIPSNKPIKPSSDLCTHRPRRPSLLSSLSAALDYYTFPGQIVYTRFLFPLGLDTLHFRGYTRTHTQTDIRGKKGHNGRLILTRTSRDASIGR